MSEVESIEKFRDRAKAFARDQVDNGGLSDEECEAWFVGELRKRDVAIRAAAIGEAIEACGSDGCRCAMQVCALLNPKPERSGNE